MSYTVIRKSDAIRRQFMMGLLACLVGLSLTACGGGSGSSPVGTTTNGITGLSIVDLAPDSVSSETYEGKAVQNVTITGGLVGNMDALSGKTLYLFAIVPDPLFRSTPDIKIDATNRTASITLVGVVPPDGAKTYSNNITIRACLDPDCRVELDNSNAKIPYTITVKPGLTVGSSNVELNTTFGTVPAPVTVPITLPSGTMSWEIKDLPYSIDGTWSQPIQVSKATDGSSNVVFSAGRLVLPGSTYSLNIGLEAAISDGQKFYKMINVFYKTDASDVPYAFAYPSANFTVKYGYMYFSEELPSSILFPSETSDKVKLLETTYVAWPDAAADHSFRDKWVYSHVKNAIFAGNSPSNVYSSTVKVIACDLDNCLPVGHYSAKLHFQYTSDTGDVSDLYYPVEMDIVP